MQSKYKWFVKVKNHLTVQIFGNKGVNIGQVCMQICNVGYCVQCIYLLIIGIALNTPYWSGWTQFVMLSM